MNPTLHRVCIGSLDTTWKCWMPGRKGKCNRRGTWLVFPAGEGTLDTTQLSNLCATPCDQHLALAIKRSAETRKKEKT